MGKENTVTKDAMPRVIRVHYPLLAEPDERIVLRTDKDWHHNVEAIHVSSDRREWIFQLQPASPHCYFKPALVRGHTILWARSGDCVALGGTTHPVDVYPHFLDDGNGRAERLRAMLDGDYQRRHSFRVFTPPGYRENTLRHYPVLYMLEGQSFFFRNNAFDRHHWRIAETLEVLRAIHVIEPMIVVGIYPERQLADLTAPGYEAFGRFLAERLKPTIDTEYRTLPGAEHTATMGSSLGGVASFYLAWEHSETFGMAACLSTPFAWRDDLVDRVGRQPKRDCRLYLDSGSQAEADASARRMHTLLVECGFEEGVDVMYRCHSRTPLDACGWAMWIQVPIDFLFGRRPSAPRSLAARPGWDPKRSSDHYLG